MPIDVKWKNLGAARVAVPEDTGIYEFGIKGDDGKILEVYIGSAGGERGIRGRVIAHINCSKSGNADLAKIIKGGADVYCRWEAEGMIFGPDPKGMEHKHLKKFLRKHGKFPACNKKLEIKPDGTEWLDELLEDG